jgi:ABC-2 type transport system ATP-binding protein
LASGVQARSLGKRYGSQWALQDLDLDVPFGSVLGLLGHNGAGKTTTIRMLTTLTAPSTGHAWVAGFDVVDDPKRVRAHIGVTGQGSTVDALLTGRANLEMIGRLYHLPRRIARERAQELLDRFDLEGASDRLVREYSGGMRRRLDLAASLIGSPAVIFLDEPTTGLDPRSRVEFWGGLDQLVADGTTLLLTSQYLDEVDRIADSVVVLDHGRVVGAGTPAELKSRLGRDRIEVTVTSAEALDRAAVVLADRFLGRPETDHEGLTVSATVSAGTRFVDVVRALDAEEVELSDVRRREPTLDDVFMALTERQPQTETVW